MHWYTDSFTLHNYPSLPGEATVINRIPQIGRNPENSSNFFKMMKLIFVQAGRHLGSLTLQATVLPIFFLFQFLQKKGNNTKSNNNKKPKAHLRARYVQPSMCATDALHTCSKNIQLVRQIWLFWHSQLGRDWQKIGQDELPRLYVMVPANAKDIRGKSKAKMLI